MAWRETWDDFTLWLGLLGFAVEVPFTGMSGTRKWRFDFAHESKRVCVEYDGLGRGKGEDQERGGHETRSGILRGAEKVNEAQLCGWRVIVCHAPTIEDGSCHKWVERALEGE